MHLRHTTHILPLISVLYMLPVAWVVASTLAQLFQVGASEQLWIIMCRQHCHKSFLLMVVLLQLAHCPMFPSHKIGLFWGYVVQISSPPEGKTSTHLEHSAMFIDFNHRFAHTDVYVFFLVRNSRTDRLYICMSLECCWTHILMRPNCITYVTNSKH